MYIKDEEKYKIIVIGDDGVGKTTLIKGFDVTGFKTDYQPTIGVNIFSREVEIMKRHFPLSFWEMNRDAKWDFFRSSFFRNVNGVLIIFDLTNHKTFVSLSDLIKEVHDYVDAIPILIIGNKKDLEEMRQVEKKEISGLIKSVSCEYLETSAKTGENINIAFEKILTMLFPKQA